MVDQIKQIYSQLWFSFSIVLRFSFCRLSISSPTLEVFVEIPYFELCEWRNRGFFKFANAATSFLCVLVLFCLLSSPKVICMSDLYRSQIFKDPCFSLECLHVSVFHLKVPQKVPSSSSWALAFIIKSLQFIVYKLKV